MLWCPSTGQSDHIRHRFASQMTWWRSLGTSFDISSIFTVTKGARFPPEEAKVQGKDLPSKTDAWFSGQRRCSVYRCNPFQMTHFITDLDAPLWNSKFLTTLQSSSIKPYFCDHVHIWLNRWHSLGVSGPVSLMDPNGGFSKLGTPQIIYESCIVRNQP